MKEVHLSVIVPYYNEGSNLPLLHRELIEVLKKISGNTEILYIDDGSNDNCSNLLEEAISTTSIKNVSVKVLKLRRNSGQTAAIAAGLDSANGRYISFLDADLQSDPNDLPKFLNEINKGYDAVFGWRKNREDDTARSITSRIANFIIQKIFQSPIHDVGCSLRIVKKELLMDIHLYGESHRIMPVLIYWRSNNISELIVNHRKRGYGKSKYGYTRIIKLVIDLITLKFLVSYGTKPAYVFGSFGIVSIFLGLITFLLVAYRKLFLGVFVHRDPLFIIAIFLSMVGIQLILMGLLAELLVRVYFESQNRPIYELAETKNF